MSGHLFLVRGDVTRLHCDAFAVPTDQYGSLVDSFIAHAPGPWKTRTRRIEGELLETLRRDGAVAALEWPGCHFLDIGRLERAPMAVYEKAIQRFIALALESAPNTFSNRERPLLALPVVGARHGGAAKERAEHAAELLGMLQTVIDDHAEAFDLVVVTWTPELFAWCQQVRRQRASRAVEELSQEQVLRAQDLGSLASQGRLVLFIGAGVSAGVGLPTWTSLLESLEDDVLEPGRRAAVRELDVLDRAAVISSLLEDEKRTVGDAVAERFAASVKPGLQHALLASLPVTEMATTNFDRLLELAADAAHDPVVVIPYSHAQDAKRWLLKLHGDIKHTGSIVLTREDYLSYPEQRGALRGVVQALLLTRHMLFVGFSMTDDNFSRIAHDVRRVTAMAAIDEDVRLGTVLSLFEDKGRELLWGKDLRTLAMTTKLANDTSESASARHLAQASRLHEIFLDRVLLEASPSSLHILDPTFDTALTVEDRKAKELLLAIQKAAAEYPAETSPAWKQVHRLLDMLGGGSR